MQTHPPRFAAALTCIDGRTVEPVLSWVRRSARVEHVDLITEPGLDGVLATGGEDVSSLLARVRVSCRAHGSRVLAVVGHHDCAGHPADEATHRRDISRGVVRVQRALPEMEVVGLWVGEDGSVERVE